MLEVIADGGARVGQPFLLAKVRVELIELPHLALGSPTQVAVPRLSEIGARTRLEPARTVETPGHLVRERLDAGKAARAGRSDGLFVQSFGVQFPSVETGDLCADQRRTAREILGAIRGPFEKSLVMGGDSREQVPSLVLACRTRSSRPGQRTIEVIFGLQEVSAGRPEKSLCLRRHGCGAIVLGRVDISLQFADPVPARGAREPRVILQMLLEVVLVELFTAKGPEHGCQPPQRPDQTELPGHEIKQHTDALLA